MKNKKSRIETVKKKGDIEIIFHELPLFNNVQESPGIKNSYDLSLRRHPVGFIIQSTCPDTLSKIHKLYSQKEYNFITNPPGTSSWANRLGDERIAFINTAADFSKKSVVEIGAGSLYIAQKLLQQHDISRYVIVDPAIKESPGDSRVQIKREYFSAELFTGDNIDAIICLSVLEHVPDPVKFLFEIRSLLRKPKGIGIFVFPDTEKQFNQGDLNAILHEHISYFSKSTIFRLMAHCGFEVIFCKSEFNVFNVIARPAEIGTKTWTDSYIADLAQNGEMFRRNILAISNYMHNLNGNKKIAFHGANNGLNNLISLAEVEPADNIFIFDSDEFKTGKYLPSWPAPILNFLDSRYSAIDEVFISATSFYDEICSFLVKQHGINKNNIHPLYPYQEKA